MISLRSLLHPRLCESPAHPLALPDLAPLAARLGVKRPIEVRFACLNPECAYVPPGCLDTGTQELTAAYTPPTDAPRPHVIYFDQRAYEYRVAPPPLLTFSTGFSCGFDLKAVLIHEVFHAAQQERCCATALEAKRFYYQHGRALEASADRAGCDPALRALVCLPGEEAPCS